MVLPLRLETCEVSRKTQQAQATLATHDLDTPNGGTPQKKSSKDLVDTLTNLTVAPGSPRETNGSHRVRRTSREVALRSSTAPTTRSEEPSARALTTTRALTLAAAVTVAFMLVVELKALAAAAMITGSTTRVAQQRAATPIDDSVLLASGALPSPLACARHGTVRHAHSEVTATGPTRPPHDRLSPPTCLCAPQI